ncbi:hypothetical protein AVEN_147077-1 [Araneus ventricosus]|uniref:Uncharacterized protein n=1 Tax=Araneus ventricosus TaxID=182803 RepID=A0A4Y2E201_ARAVE|nr:hypothetical protein AVEN_147077-1 [Araneus ventricosus]
MDIMHPHRNQYMGLRSGIAVAMRHCRLCQCSTKLGLIMLKPHIRHWGNSVRLFSGAEIDGSRWEQYRDCRQKGPTPPRGTAAVVVCAEPYEDKRRGTLHCQHTAYSPDLVILMIL